MVNYILNQAQRDQHRQARRLGKLTPRQQMQRQEFIRWAKPYGKYIGGILTAKNNPFMEDLAQLIHAHYLPSDKQMRAAINVVGRRRDVERYSATSRFVGRPKQKIEFEAVVVGVYESGGYYGPVDIVKLRDEDGNLFTWFASNPTDLHRSDRVFIKGTVKKHDEYRGIKNTCLTRCKFNKFEVMES